MQTGGSTPVYRVTAGGAVTYLRLGEEPGERRDAEVRVHELLRERGVPVPEVLRFEPTPPELDRSAVLTSTIAGRPIARSTPIAVVRRIACHVGHDLATISTIPVTGYGWVDSVGGEDRRLVAEHATRAIWAAEYLVATETVIASGIFDDDVSGTLREAMRMWADLPDRGSSRLAHGDFDTSHIYTDPETDAYTGIIDFGEIRGADSFYDLGHISAHAADAFGAEVFDAVLTGYRERVDLPADAERHIRVQATAIATRALSIQLGRPQNAYRRELINRLHALLGDLNLAG